MLDGLTPENPGLLQYWLGAWALKLLPAAMPPDLVVRLPFMLLLVLALLCTWRAVFSLARTPGAQPVAFAFGGEASPQTMPVHWPMVACWLCSPAWGWRSFHTKPATH